MASRVAGKIKLQSVDGRCRKGVGGVQAGTDQGNL